MFWALFPGITKQVIASRHVVIKQPPIVVGGEEGGQ